MGDSSVQNVAIALEGKMDCESTQSMNVEWNRDFDVPIVPNYRNLEVIYTNT